MAIRNDSTGECAVLTTGLFDYNSTYTIAAWIRPGQVNSAWHDIFCVHVDSGTQWHNRDYCGVNASNQWSLATNVASVGGGVQDGTVVQDTWYHVAMVRASSSVLRLYVNGSQISTDLSQSVTGRTAADRLAFGSVTWNTAQYFNGRMAQMKIWTAALTAAQLIQESQSNRPSLMTNLWAWYPTWFGSGERTKDYSGNGRNLSESGTLSDEDNPPISWGAGV